MSVNVYDAGDTTKPLVTTATDQSGTYNIAQLAAGKYKLSFKRAGYIPLWYPAATTDADATAVEVKTGEQKKGLDIALGGLPASISGTVSGDDVSGSTLYLETAPAGRCLRIDHDEHERHHGAPRDDHLDRACRSGIGCARGTGRRAHRHPTR